LSTTWNFFSATIQVSNTQTPAIVAYVNGAPTWSFWYQTGAVPEVNGIFDAAVPSVLMVYGGFDNIGTYVTSGNTTPDPYRPFDIATFNPSGVYDNAAVFPLLGSGASKGVIGGPIRCHADGATIYDFVPVPPVANPGIVFGGSFNALDTLTTTPHNIVCAYFVQIFSATIGQWSVPTNLGTNGPVNALVIYNNTNLFVGGDFTMLGTPPTFNVPFICRYDLATQSFNNISGIIGLIIDMKLSTVDGTQLIAYGNPSAAGASGSRVVYINVGTLSITPGSVPSVSGVSLVSPNVGRKITSGTLINNPPAPATGQYDIIAISGATNEPIVVYISNILTQWTLVGGPATQSINTNPISLYYNATAAPSPVLFVQQNATQYLFNQLTTLPPIQFTLANGFLFNSLNPYSSATLNANTSQSFIAGGSNGTKFICCGGLAPGLLLT
jgi:hypothetical protein